MSKTQSKLANTILQRPMRVEVAGKHYDVPQPTLATIIMASEKIAELPKYDIDAEKPYSTVLSQAKHCKTASEVCAILILGAKRLRSLDRLRRRRAVTRLSRDIELDCSLAELNVLLKRLLATIDVKDFFAITTFLQGINLTEPKKVEAETTAPGR